MSVFSAIGHGLEAFFKGGVKVAEVAEPLVDILFPGVAPLFNSIVGQIGSAETAALAAAQQNGTGVQKLALVVASVQSSITQFEKDNGITTPHTQEQITNIVNGLVQALNNLNAPGK